VNPLKFSFWSDVQLYGKFGKSDTSIPFANMKHFLNVSLATPYGTIFKGALFLKFGWIMTKDEL